MGETRARVPRQPRAIKTDDTGIPELRSWEKHTIGQKVGISIWEKLGLQEMADQKPLPFDIRQIQSPDNPFRKKG